MYKRRAHRHARGGQVERLLLASEAARQAEVRHLDLALARQQDVFRLDVPMHKAQLAGALQGGGRLAHDRQRQRQVGRSLAGQVIPQGAALDIFQGHEVVAVRLTDRIDLHDVGVRDGGDSQGLGVEPFQAGGVGSQFGLEQLQRHLPLECLLHRQVDLAHAALAELAQNMRNSPRVRPVRSTSPADELFGACRCAAAPGPRLPVPNRV
jgi:hypothetical protein